MKQHRPPTRAPHGQPEYIAVIAVRVTKDMHKSIMRKGGSGWVRNVIEKSLK